MRIRITAPAPYDPAHFEFPRRLSGAALHVPGRLRQRLLAGLWWALLAIAGGASLVLLGTLASIGALR